MVLKFLNVTSQVSPKPNMTWYPEERLYVWGLNCPAIFNHCRRRGWDRRQTSMGSQCSVIAPSQPFKMTSVTVPCWYVSQKTQLDRLQEYTEPRSFLQASSLERSAERQNRHAPLVTCAVLYCNSLSKYKSRNYCFSCFCWAAVFTLDHSILYKASGIWRTGIYTLSLPLTV